MSLAGVAVLLSANVYGEAAPRHFEGIVTVTDAGADPEASRAEVRDGFCRWMHDHVDDLAPFRRERPVSLEEQLAEQRPLQRLLFDAGWTRLGWPVAHGGLGGSRLARAVVIDELAAAGYAVPELLGNTDIVGSMLVRFAPEIATEHLGPAIAGDEVWCQGFSEPDAGSDLASLRTRAVEDGDHFRITGQKTWSSDGHLATGCVLLARTGPVDSGHRGLTMFWLDMSTPGVTTRPIACVDGRAEVAEIWLDGAVVGRDRVVGDVGGGWRAVMYLMQFERGAYAWQRQADLRARLEELLAQRAPTPSPAAPGILGDAFLRYYALRAKCRGTLAALDAGCELGPEISVDKVMLGLAEQSVADAARSLMWPPFVTDDGDDAALARRRWAYSRITTIYGGSAEVQRDLIAERLLGLPRGR